MYHVLISEAVDLFSYSNDRLSVTIDEDLSKNQADLIHIAKDMDALVVRNLTKVNSDLISQLSSSTKVRVIGRLGAGLDNIDTATARHLGIEVVYAPDANTESTVEYVLGQILVASRKLFLAHRGTARGEWTRLSFVGRQISELTVGILGYGRVGQRLSTVLCALGAKVIVSTRRPECVPASLDVVSVDELFSSADVVSIHVPLTKATRGLVNARLLNLMKPGSIFVNTSRGETVVEEDLDKLLYERPDIIAVLDVRQEEPPTDRRFVDRPNTLLSPHIAAFTVAAQTQVAKTVLDDIANVLSGNQPVNPAP